MTSAIEARGLVKTYPKDVRALDGIDLDVEAGTIFGLLGPNRPILSSLRAGSRTTTALTEPRSYGTLPFVAYCAQCGDNYQRRPGSAPAAVRPLEAIRTEPVRSPTRTRARDDPRLGAWRTGRWVLGGLLAVNLTDQAMCPQAILGPCQSLTSQGRTEIIVLAVVVGGIIGRLIGRARARRS